MTEEESNKEAESAMEFCKQYIKDDDTERKFHEAIHDSRLKGFKDGMKAALNLFTELS